MGVGRIGRRQVGAIVRKDDTCRKAYDVSIFITALTASPRGCVAVQAPPWRRCNGPGPRKCRSEKCKFCQTNPFLQRGSAKAPSRHAFSNLLPNATLCRGHGLVEQIAPFSGPSRNAPSMSSQCAPTPDFTGIPPPIPPGLQRKSRRSHSIPPGKIGTKSTQPSQGCSSQFKPRKFSRKPESGRYS